MCWIFKSFLHLSFIQQMLTESFPLWVSGIAQGTLYLKIDYIMILKWRNLVFWVVFHFLFLFCLFQPRSHNNLQCYTLRVSTEGLNDIYREIKLTRYLPKTFHLSPLPTPPRAYFFSFSLSLSPPSYFLSFPFIFPTLCLITRNVLLVSNVLPKLGKHTSPLKLIVCLGYIIHLVVAPAGSSGKLVLRWS